TLHFLIPVPRQRPADHQEHAGLNYRGQLEEPPTVTSGEEDAGELGRSLLVLRTLGDEPLLASEPLHGVEKQVFIAQQGQARVTGKVAVAIDYNAGCSPRDFSRLLCSRLAVSLVVQVDRCRHCYWGRTRPVRGSLE